MGFEDINSSIYTRYIRNDLPRINKLLRTTVSIKEEIYIYSKMTAYPPFLLVRQETAIVELKLQLVNKCINN